MGIISLPNDIFLPITLYLSPFDLIKCRLVSKGFFGAFTEPDFNRFALQRRIPNFQEARKRQIASIGFRSRLWV
ncbi:hypothetical protein BJ878DRAFT_518490, partial [Calycina marina]